MGRIAPPLHWDESNIAHLWQSHRVTQQEVEEILFGFTGQEPTYRLRRMGPYLMVFGETGSGRLLKMVGEFKDKRFRVFAARDMNVNERRAYRRRK